MSTIRTTRGGAAALLIVIGVGGLVYLLKARDRIDESTTTEVTTGLATGEKRPCLVQTAPKQPDTAGRADQPETCFYSLSSEVYYPLVRGQRVEVTWDKRVEDGRELVRKVVVDGKVVHTADSDKLGWHRYILHIGAALTALIGFLMLWAYRKDSWHE
jgi:hypothetical protein